MLERGLPKFASFLKEVPGTLQCFENVSRNNDRRIFLTDIFIGLLRCCIVSSTCLKKTPSNIFS